MKAVKPWPLGHMRAEFLQRTTPGPGAQAKDDGSGGAEHLKLRSVPNVATARLVRRHDYLWLMTRTSEGLRAHDGTRRSLVELCVHRQCVAHELRLRGVVVPS